MINKHLLSKPFTQMHMRKCQMRAVAVVLLELGNSIISSHQKELI